MPVEDQTLRTWMGNARMVTERLTSVLREVDELIFQYDDTVGPIVSESQPGDVVDEGRPELPVRTVADLSDLVRHLKLVNLAGNGDDGIIGVTNLQAHSNTIGNDFGPKNARRKFHVRSRFGLFTPSGNE